MTIVDQIVHEAKALPAGKRKEALRALRTLRSQSNGIHPSTISTRKTLGKARAAIHAVRGLWRGRTDLPRDTVEASLELQRRVMKRG